MARRPSTIDRLPEPVRELIGQLFRNGRTLDEILDKLRELDVDVSRSALGRHTQKLATIAERLRTSRAIAESLVSQFGDEADNRLARVNLELMHSVVMQTLTHAEIDETTGEAKPVVFDPEQAMFLATALQRLATAEKTNDDRVTKAREMATKEAAKKAGDALRAKGFTAETVDLVRYAVLGTQA